MIHALGALALTGYLIAIVLFSLDLFHDSNKRALNAERALLIGFIAHTTIIILTFFSTGSLLSTGRADFYLLLSWGFPVAYACIRRHMRFPIVGSFLSAATILFLASSSYLLHLSQGRDLALGVGFQILHILPALIAELSLIIAVALSVIYCIQDQRLKSKKALDALFSAPNLDILARWNLKLISWGFIAMSFSVVSGSIWALINQRNIITSDPFQWMGFLVWILLAFIHLIRAIKGHSSRLIAHTILLAGVVIITALCVFLLFGWEVSHGTLYLS